MGSWYNLTIFACHKHWCICWQICMDTLQNINIFLALYQVYLTRLIFLTGDWNCGFTCSFIKQLNSQYSKLFKMYWWLLLPSLIIELIIQNSKYTASVHIFVTALSLINGSSLNPDYITLEMATGDDTVLALSVASLGLVSKAPKVKTHTTVKTQTLRVLQQIPKSISK